MRAAFAALAHPLWFKSKRHNMFMFTFSVLTISIVGLFFQIVSAITAYFLSQQLALGEQMLKWHSIAFEYSCTSAGVGLPDLSPISKADVGRSGELVGSYNWNTVIFENGTYNGVNRRMLVTYVLPTEKPNGFSVTDLARQIQKVTIKQHYRFGRVSGHTVKFTVFDSGVPTTIDIAGLPSATPDVVDNSVVLVSDATCN